MIYQNQFKVFPLLSLGFTFLLLTSNLFSQNSLFVSSNTESKIQVLDIASDGSTSLSEIATNATDADGIYYDTAADVLYQLNRTDNVINAYSNVSSNPTLTATSTSDFSNGREIAASGNKLVVAQDAAASNNDMNRLLVYTISPTSITLDKVYDVSINLWGIHTNGNQLIAIVDNSSDVAIYDNFFNQPAGMLLPSGIVMIEDMVRTHGLTYDAEDDVMYLTDVGEASSSTDGAIIMVKNWSSAIADGMVDASEQGRASGGSSLLGNPVDIAIDTDNRMIYVAERARDGGRLLGFRMPLLTGGIRPSYDLLFPGASAVFLSGTEVPFDICDFVNEGTVSLPNGDTRTTIVVDGQADMLSFNTTAVAPTGGAFTYVVTDANNMVLGIPPGNMVDFDPAGLGSCIVYGLSYTGNLTLAMGDNLMGGQALSDDCFKLTTNSIVVSRIAPTMPAAGFFVSSNTTGNIGAFAISNNGDVVQSSFASNGMDADGIFYDTSNDVLYQLNRTNNTVDLFSNVSTNPTLVASSTSDFSNGREIAVTGSKLIVAQDANAGNGDQNKLIVYDITSSSITLDKIYDVDINLWGIHANGGQLFAIVDNSSNVAIFDNFFTQSAGMLTPTTVVTIENLVRTHGIHYVADKDMMFLTDVGAASSPTDGALIRVKQWSTASADGTVSAMEQIRVAGGTSGLGNPVDVAYDSGSDMVYVAERANGGGRVLGYRNPNASGGIAPVYSTFFEGASGIHLPGNEVDYDPCDVVAGGTVSFADGNIETTIIVDGQADMLSFASTADPMGVGHSFTYVVTDANNTILGIPPGNMVDFDPAGVGACLVYGLSYTGNLSISMGDNLMGGQDLSDACFNLSSNNLVVNRVMAGPSDGTLYVSSNNQSNIGVFDLQSTNVVPGMISVSNMDSDGIFYDKIRDILYQLDRTNNVVNLYTTASTNPTLAFTSTSDFSNGREIAVSSTKLVVAQDANAGNGNQNRLIVYNIVGSTIVLDKIFDVNINLWGIHQNGTQMIAIVDNSSDVAIFDDFFVNAAGMISPTRTITIENMVRTHGLTYDTDSDLMILTDVGAASSNNDGALVVVNNWTTVSADNLVTAGEQIRVLGATSFLGNPVDVALDKTNNRIYVAERANGGGRVLGYNMPVASGGIAPVYNRLFTGASAVNFSSTECNLTQSTIKFLGGATEATVTVGDGNADLLTLKSSMVPNISISSTYVITDEQDIVLAIPFGNMVNFETSGIGSCRIYQVAYIGNLTLIAGDDINNTILSDECSALSTNFLTVERVQAKPTAPTIAARSTKASSSVEQVFPNPTSDKLNLVIKSTTEHEGIIQIFNLNGAILQQEAVQFMNGINRLAFDVSSLPTGTYMFRVPGTNNVSKFIKTSR